jgi:anti-sigma B factor antagonist
VLPTVPAPQVTRVDDVLPESSSRLAGLYLDVRPVVSAGACTVVVAGEVDHLTAPHLREALLGVLCRPHLPRDVVVDLSRVTHLGAAGLTALAVAHRAAADGGRVLHVCCGTARAVIRPLQVTGLWQVLTTAEPRQVARNG